MPHKILTIKNPRLFAEAVELCEDEDSPYQLTIHKSYWLDSEDHSRVKKWRDGFVTISPRDTEEHKLLAESRTVSFEGALKALNLAAIAMEEGIPLPPSIASYFSKAIQETIKVSMTEIGKNLGTIDEEISRVATNTLAKGLGILSGNKRSSTTDYLYRHVFERNIERLVEGHSVLKEFDWGDILDDDEQEAEASLNKLAEYTDVEKRLRKDKSIIREARELTKKQFGLKARTEQRYWHNYQMYIKNRRPTIFERTLKVIVDNAE
jgi:hypothetical protein